MNNGGMGSSDDYNSDLYNSPDPSSHYEWKNYTVSVGRLEDCKE